MTGDAKFINAMRSYMIKLAVKLKLEEGSSVVKQYIELLSSVNALMLSLYGCPVSSVGRAWDS